MDLWEKKMKVDERERLVPLGDEKDQLFANYFIQKLGFRILSCFIGVFFVSAAYES